MPYIAEVVHTRVVQVVVVSFGGLIGYPSWTNTVTCTACAPVELTGCTRLLPFHGRGYIPPQKVAHSSLWIPGPASEPKVIR